MEHVEYFVYMGSMMTNDARSKPAREIKFRIVMTGAAFRMKKTAAANWI
jgi:hypothetical protein